MSVRPTSDADRVKLKRAFHLLVELAGGVSLAENVTRVRAAALSKFGSLSDEQFAPIDVVLDLERSVGSPVVTNLLAEMQGYRTARGPAASGAGAPGLEDLARLVRESADVTTAFAAAAIDGRFDPHEVREINREIEENIVALRDLQSRIQGAAGSPPASEAQLKGGENKS